MASSSSSSPSPTTESGYLLNNMADLLRAEVAQQYNMSVEDYLSSLPVVSMGSLNVEGRMNGSEGQGQREGENDVEISSGVAWTLVAPLILLAVLVAVGVTVACLWKLKDRRCGRGETGSEVGGGERGGGGGEIELQELSGGEFRSTLPGPISSTGSTGLVPGSADPPQSLTHGDLQSRFRQYKESASRPHPHHHRPSYLRDGAPDKKGIQLHSQVQPDQEVVVTPGSEKAKYLTVHGNGQDIHKLFLENQARLEMGVEIPQDFYCSLCQHYIAQRYQHDACHLNAYLPKLYHTVPRHQLQGDPKHHEPQFHQYKNMPGGSQLPKHCQQCADRHNMLQHHNHHRVISQSHETSLHRVHERDHLRQISQSLDDHLHLVPRYQPPPPGPHNPQPFTDHQDRTPQPHQHAHQNTFHIQNPDLSKSQSHKHGHGLENPLFLADTEDEDSICSDSCRETSAGNGDPKRGQDERGRERRETPRIINSTSMMSTYGDSDPTQSGQTHHGRHHSVNPGGKSKPLVEGPDVSSIKMPSSASQAWHRGSSRLLPSTTHTINSSQTPSYNSSSSKHTTNNEKSDGDTDDDPEREETLSLPSSISRFHASRVQFPPLMPDAQYPLTSTKAFFSPSWRAQPSKGEGPATSGEGNILEALETFSDNTSLQPNVGSSVTSGQLSEIRGSQSQTVSSSVSDPWGAPVHLRHPPSSPSRFSNRQDASSGTDQEKARKMEYAYSDKIGVVNDRDFDNGSGNQHKDVHNVDDQNAGEVLTDSDFPDSYVKARHRKSEPSSLHLPASATELHRERIQKGRKRKERAKSEHKHGFFLIPRQDPQNGNDGHDHHHAVVKVSEASKNVRPVSSPCHLSSTSEPRVVSRPPMYRKTRVSMVEEIVQHPSFREYPTTKRNSLNSPRDGVSSNIHHPTRENKSPSYRQRRKTEPFEQHRMKSCSVEQHPTKLYSCKPSRAYAEHRHRHPTQEASTHSKEFHLVNERKLENIGDDNSCNLQSSKRRLSITDPFPQLMAFKASSMSASFPAVNQGPLVNVGSIPRPTGATLDNRSSKSSRAKLKRTKSYEDHAYINMGGSFFDDMMQSARKRQFLSSVAQSGLVRDSLSNSVQLTSFSDQQMTQSQGGQATPSRSRQKREYSGLSNARTDSQIMADILNSFPQNSLPTDINANKQGDRQNLGTVYTDVTIPTAFADELFGFWTLTPELDDDISPSQPRTPLMTPLKEEAKKANRKFIWGNSGSPSGSTSTSSFVPGVQYQDDTSVDTRKRNLSHQSRVDDFDDYVQMVKDSSDQPRSNSQQMSISDSPSIETVPPTPTVKDVEGNVFLNFSNLSTVDEHKTLPVNNVNTNRMSVPVGNDYNGNNNNNNAGSNLVSIDNSAVNLTSTSQQLTTGSMTSADIQNRNSTPASFAIVLEEQKYWL